MIVGLYIGMIISFLPSALFAVECKPVNLITQANSPFEKIPVYDQGNSPLCYAYTAAQLADYDLISRGLTVTRTVHPIRVAWQLAESVYDWEFRGHVSDALNFLRRSGHCIYEHIDTSMSLLSQKTNLKETDVIKFIRDLAIINYEKGADNFNENFNAAAKNIRCNLSSLEPLRLLLQGLGVTTAREMLSPLAFSSCPKNTKPLSLPPARKISCMQQGNFGWISKCTDEDFVDTTRDSLNRFSNPLAISYCRRGFETDKYDGNEVNNQGFRVQKGDCSPHAALVVGQKPRGDSCNYLIRNSAGNGWSDWNENLSCLCRHKETGKFKDNCTRAGEDHDDYDKYSVEACWIPESKFKQNVYDITSLNSD